MHLNATGNTKQSALLHSLGDAFNIYNVENDTCSATVHSPYYFFLYFFNNTVENTLLRFHGNAFNIYTDNISISTTQKTTTNALLLFMIVALCVVEILQDRLFTWRRLWHYWQPRRHSHGNNGYANATQWWYTYTAYLVRIFMGDVLPLLVIPCQMR
jgi:hypothetical protein